MVFYFQASTGHMIYMGKDKYENDNLIKYGFPEDIWFHVEKLSSAHVYLRLPEGSMDLMNIKDKDVAKQMLRDALASIPEDVLQEMCQLTKANSIDGCKVTVDVVYTPFLNLKKEERMDVGQVSFKDEQFRLHVRNVEKDKEIVKRLEKTQVWKDIDYKAERETRDNSERERRRKFNVAQKQREKEEEKKHREEKELRSYESLQNLEGETNQGLNKTGSVEECREIEDDFM